MLSSDESDYDEKNNQLDQPSKPVEEENKKSALKTPKPPPIYLEKELIGLKVVLQNMQFPIQIY